MEISLRVVEAGECASRWHYCLGRARVVGFDTSGITQDAQLYCPLCGALTSTRQLDTRPGPVDKDPRFQGARCVHGYPDAACSALLSADDSLEYDYLTAIPEFRAARLASDFGASAGLDRWARPCPPCRDEFARAHHALIEMELRQLCESLSRESAKLVDGISRLQSEINLAHALLADLPRAAAQPAADEASRGYVYAITDGTAIKIGWSAGHPGLPGGRLSQLQTAHHAELRLIGAVVAGRLHERDLHRRFGEFHVRGEWFRFAESIVEYFDPR